MNIQQLSPDAKYSLFQELPGVDLVKLCNTNKNFRSICQKQKYTTIWQQKIEKDFNNKYTEKDAYMEYLRLLYLYSTDIWSLIFADQNEPINPDYTYTMLFDSKEKALGYAMSMVDEFYGYKKENGEKEDLFKLLSSVKYRLENDEPVKIGCDSVFLKKDTLSKTNRDNYLFYYNELLNELKFKISKEFDDDDVAEEIITTLVDDGENSVLEIEGIIDDYYFDQEEEDNEKITKEFILKKMEIIQKYIAEMKVKFEQE